jgi:hypothetical protein
MPQTLIRLDLRHNQSMKSFGTLLIALGCIPAAIAQQSAAPPTPGTTIDREIGIVERAVVAAAQAMPEDKYKFSPESMAIAGADFKGVFTFAGLVKHLAATNLIFWGAAGGDSVPSNVTTLNGPAMMTSKSEIVQMLKDSFTSGHHAAAAFTLENAMDMVPGPGGNKTQRLFAVTFPTIHSYDEYGQMVEYLRLNGIVPPASVPVKK